MIKPHTLHSPWTPLVLSEPKLPDGTEDPLDPPKDTHRGIFTPKISLGPLALPDASL